jgi:hypothetical protein
MNFDKPQKKTPTLMTQNPRPIGDPQEKIERSMNKIISY